MGNESTTVGELFKGFSKLTLDQRFKRLIQMGVLTTQDVRTLKKNSGLPTELAENLIENVIGYYQIPLGIAANLKIDGQDYAIPMAIEETSVIASLSKTAKWVRQEGEITTELLGKGYVTGQIQLACVKNFIKFESIIEEHKEHLIKIANEQIAQGLVKRGGGVKEIQIRSFPAQSSDGTMVVLHVEVDTCDAMGANITTQICEMLKPHIEVLTHEKVTMCIISNLSIHKLTKARIVLRNIDPALAENIEQASYFAEQDPYRATTHNKGVLNGIDPILIATGNDWRAVEAAIHAYAVQTGQYRSITRWYRDQNNLIGELIAPIAVGTVGGMTKLHPTAQMCLRMMNIESANQLSRIIAAVGLVQNLGALKALTTVGLVAGHMRLHITNLSLSAGAKAEEMPVLQKRLEELLNFRKRITLSNAIEILKEIRDCNLTGTTSQEQTA